jgi:hypothetical protein
MANPDNTYQNEKVGRLQGAETLFVKSDGYFNVDDTDLTGAELKTNIYTALQATIIINSAGVLSTINLPSQHGYVVLSITDAASNASAWLQSCKKGQVMVVMGRGAGSIGSVLISLITGVSLVGLISGDMSSISFHMSANSQPFIRLACLSDNEWSVIEKAGQVTLQVSA